jgi:hypothetical protein
VQQLMRQVAKGKRPQLPVPGLTQGL